MIIHTDNEIDSMIKELKSPPFDDISKIRLKSPKRGHSRNQFDLNGESRNIYRLIIRQNKLNYYDFSVGLAVCNPRSNQIFRLLRYNGNSHEHTNSIENIKFKNFHIHKATERYQDIGMREDAYAEPTDKYYDLYSAIECLSRDANFDIKHDAQQTLL